MGFVQQNDPKVGLKLLLFSFLVLCVLIFYLGYQVIANSKKHRAEQNDRLVLSSGKVQDIELFQSEKGLGINVIIYGKSSGEYQLTLKLSASTYVKNLLIERPKTVSLHFEKQIFSFDVPFDDLAKAYRRALQEYIPNFEKKFGVEEILTVEASLQLLPLPTPVANDPNIAAELSRKKPHSDSKVVLAKFFFSCQGESCEIVQSEKPVQESTGEPFQTPAAQPSEEKKNFSPQTVP